MTISYSTFCIYGSCMIPGLNGDYFLNSINQLIFLMVKCCVLFEVRTEFLNIIKARIGFKELNVGSTAKRLGGICQVK
jgi:hypothetical protein